MHKIIAGLVLLVVLFSSQGFSQTTEKSEHPLLDKYYPQLQKPKVDTNRAITNQINQEPQIKSLPPVTNVSDPASKPLVTAAIIPADTTSATSSVTTTVPSVTTKSAINNTNSNVTTVSPLSTKLVINKQDTVTAKMPVQQITPPQQAPTQPYMDTRLGSSSPQYDTWEKNDNGAGAVTTSPK